MIMRRYIFRFVAWTAFVLYQLIIIYDQYASRGTVWHYLVHSMIGTGLGLAVAALISIVRKRPSNPWLWALLFQLISVVPDYIFGLLRMPHDRNMDLYLGHISIHTAPLPLFASLLVFIVGGWAWYVASSYKNYRLALILVAVCIGIWAADLTLHKPLPSRLSDYSQRFN